MINTDYAQYRAWAELDHPYVKQLYKEKLPPLDPIVIKSNIITAKYRRTRGKAKL